MAPTKRQAIPVPKSPPRRPGETGRVRLDQRFAAVLSSDSPMPAEGPFRTEHVPEALDDLRVAAANQIGHVVVPKTLSRPHPSIARLLAADTAREAKRAGRGWGEGAVFANPVGKRCLQLLSALFLALTRHGVECDAWSDDGKLVGRALVGDTAVGISLQPATGKAARIDNALELTVNPHWGRQLASSWVDDRARRLDQRLGDIAAHVIAAGEGAFRQRLLEQVKEAQRRQKEAEAAELARRAAIEVARLETLQESARLFRQACDIRALVDAVIAAAANGSSPISTDQLASWRIWALACADHLDPLRSGQLFESMPDNETEER